MTSPDFAPELAPYQDEPAQMPSGSPGKLARLALRFERRGDRSILASMDRRAPLLVQKALYCDEGMPDLPVVFIITNSGGILQGDRYSMRFEVGPGARGHVTTQAATKIHEMDANYAVQEQEIVLHDGSYLEYMPDQVIPFARSRFLTRTAIRIAPDATLLYSEILVGGRKHYGAGELFAFDLFSSTVRATRPDGVELFTEKFLIEPGRDAIRRPGMMADFDVFGNVVLLTPKAHADRIFEQSAPSYDPGGRWASGVGRLPNDCGLVLKVLGREASDVHARIRDFWSLVRPEVVGRPVPPAFSWR
ncbi:urease accessory protein UreD [Tundrisphaera sp. TA3]|uniref:urease accessory protein UreD n=1 Tax=Tundrisphaera sp. TA3 TaxID=3435775 RepID=UPI003EB907D5